MTTIPFEQLNDAAQAVLSDTPAEEHDVLEIGEPPELVVDLPGGFYDPFTQTVRVSAEVREMTGEDEEALARIDPVKNLSKFYDELLKRCLVSIDGEPVPVVSALLMGDRDFLLVAIRRVTYGDEMEFTMLCPKCGENGPVTVHLSKDIPVVLDESPEKRTHSVTLRAGVAEVRFPTGEDQSMVLAKSSAKTVPEMNTLLLSRVVETIDGNLVDAGKIRRLSSRDRKALMTFLSDKNPGLRVGAVKVPCSACGFELPLSLDLADLLPV